MANNSFMNASKAKLVDLKRLHQVKQDIENNDCAYKAYYGLNLTNVDFKGVDLFCTNFQGANCHGTNFQNCNMESACFIGAYIRYAKFSGANLTQATFHHCTGKELYETEPFEKAHILDIDFSQLT